MNACCPIARSLAFALCGVLAWSGVRAGELPAATVPALPEIAGSAEAFVPAGWRLERKLIGDIDGDGTLDLVVVIRQVSPSFIMRNEGLGTDTFNSNPRSLFVALRKKNGQFMKVSANHRIIPRVENGMMDDPFDGITLKGRVLKLTLHYWTSAGSWSMFNKTFAFRWQANGMKLIGYDYLYVKRNSGEIENISINYLTSRKMVETGDIADDHGKRVWSTTPSGPLMSLSQIGDGFEFEH